MGNNILSYFSCQLSKEMSRYERPATRLRRPQQRPSPPATELNSGMPCMQDQVLGLLFLILSNSKVSMFIAPVFPPETDTCLLDICSQNNSRPFKPGLSEMELICPTVSLSSTVPQPAGRTILTAHSLIHHPFKYLLVIHLPVHSNIS